MRKWTMGLVAALWAGWAMAATPQTVVLAVENMTCPACRITIEKALGQVHGVSRQHVDTEGGTVTVAFDADLTSAAKLADAITNAGFPAKEVRPSLEAPPKGTLADAPL